MHMPLADLTAEHLGQQVTLPDGTTDTLRSISHTLDEDGTPQTHITTTSHRDETWPSDTMVTVHTGQAHPADAENASAEAIWEGVDEGGPTGTEFTGSIRREDATYLAHLALQAARNNHRNTTTKD